MNEEKKVKRKLKWQIKFILLIVIIVLYPFFIGTKGIFIKEYKLTTSKINQNTHGLKILQFSDLNYKSNLSDTKFNNLIRKINETKPDIIIFTGDLIDKNYDVKDEDITKLKTNLKKIKAEFGKYYVPGEQDGEREVEILNSSEFINLDDKVQYVYPKSNIPIVFLSKETCNSFFSENKNEIPYNLLILHNPDDIKDFKENKIDVALAGHTLNGMINIPKIKDLLMKSKYKKNYQKVNDIDLYINPGIGERKIKARLFNHPTLYLYRLNKAS